MYGLLNSSIGESFNGFLNNAKAVFLAFRWQDAVDIVILGLLIFFVCRFLKGRKAGTLLIGVAILTALYLLSSRLGFESVAFLLSGVFRVEVAVIAVLIIFHQEIRDLLESLGSGSLKGIRTIGEQAHKKQAQYKAIDNICKAVHVMSAERTGALIVIGRTTGLEDVTNTGIAINADVSDYLIRNLFYDKAPLHDGAVIIEGNRIKAASCILPLPKHTYVNSELGTRHRAAVGMSEVSDAVIIIVSEETGVISVAKESELKRDFTEDSLRKYLVKELVSDKYDQENN